MAQLLLNGTNLTAISNVTAIGVNATAGYLNALQVCASILTMMAFGVFWRLLGVTGPTEPLVHAFNAFMFNVGVPALAFKGLAIQKFALLPWSFIAVFFCLRAALFVVWLVVDLLLLRQPLGVLVADYMNSTWINTVIFGIPIYVALYGPASAVFPIFASISSFFFQLPLQLVLLEIERRRNPLVLPSPPDAKLETAWESGAVATSRLRICSPWLLGVVVAVCANPIIIAIVGGVLFSLTGWTLPLYLDNFCTYTGDAVTPMAAFAIGVFSCRRPQTSVALWGSILLQLFIKFICMPFLAMPFLLAFGIVGVPKQMGVLMAALPVALSCYVLSVKYNYQVEHSAVMVILSTVLMLPTQLMWIAITNSFFH